MVIFRAIGVLLVVFIFACQCVAQDEQISVKVSPFTAVDWDMEEPLVKYEGFFSEKWGSIGWSWDRSRHPNRT